MSKSTSTVAKSNAMINGVIGKTDEKGVVYTTAQKFTKDLAAATKDAAEAKDESVQVNMNTVGGSLRDAQTMATDIKKNSIPVVANNDALIASAGIISYVAAPKRLTAKGAMFMIHGGSAPAEADTYQGHLDAAERLNEYNGAMALALEGVLLKKVGDDMVAMTAQEIKDTYLNDGKDHFVNAATAIEIGLAHDYSDANAENMPADITAMSSKEVMAHFGFDKAEVVAASTDIEGWDLYQAGALLGNLVNVMSCCDSLDDSENGALKTFADKVSLQTAALIQEMGGLLVASEISEASVTALATKLRNEVTAKIKPQTDVVAKAEVTKIEAKVTALTTDLTAVKAQADEAKAEAATAKAEAKTKADALAAAETKMKELLAKIPGVSAAAEVKVEDTKTEKVEAKGWEKHLTALDKERIAKGQLKLS